MPTFPRPSSSSANLSGADLSQAKLSHANLSHANLSYANLSYANLRFANFSDANLSHANLTGATLVGATLTGATLEHSECQFTTFAVVDLSEVRGLDSIKHKGPSTVGIDTLFLSKGKIPEAFLRGYGVPETLIDITCRPSWARCSRFSSTRASSATAQETKRSLSGFMRIFKGRGSACWYCSGGSEDRRIRSRVGIDESIRIHDKILLLVLSKNSVASDWVEKGSRKQAMLRRRSDNQKRVVLFLPIRLDDAVMKISRQAGRQDISIVSRNNHRRFQEVEDPRHLPEGVRATPYATSRRKSR